MTGIVVLDGFLFLFKHHGTELGSDLFLAAVYCFVREWNGCILFWGVNVICLMFCITRLHNRRSGLVRRSAACVNLATWYVYLSSNPENLDFFFSVGALLDLNLMLYTWCWRLQCLFARIPKRDHVPKTSLHDFFSGVCILRWRRLVYIHYLASGKQKTFIAVYIYNLTRHLIFIFGPVIFFLLEIGGWVTEVCFPSWLLFVYYLCLFSFD